MAVTSTSEDDFLRVLEEMNRLCGGEEGEADNEGHPTDLEAATVASGKEPRSEENVTNTSDNSELDDIFAPSSSALPLIGDQLLSSASTASNSLKRTASVSNLQQPQGSASRSRHCSANSAQSCVSFDSAIGDVYSVQTPSKEGSSSTNPTNANGNAGPVDIFDLSNKSGLDSSVSNATPSAGIQFDNLAASVIDGEILDSVEGLNGISLRLVGSEDVDLVGTPFSISNDLNENHLNSHLNKKRKSSVDQDQDQDYFSKKRKLNNNGINNNVIIKSKPPMLLTPQLMQQRQDVERICVDLLKRFQHASSLHPKTHAKVWMAKSGEDPLFITTRLLGDSLARLRIFVHSLDPMNWLSWPDRNALYSQNVCILSVLKAAVSVNLEAVPMAYPLPYGEYLGEVEALHLILAHDLYNELRALLSHIQSLGIREFPVMLLVMMIAFFSTQPMLQQPDKVVRVNDYYTHKLQVYLQIRFGSEAMVSLMTKILSTIERVRSFSHRLREFLNDVTRCGLQKHYESVCENIGLIAFLLQTEPKFDQCC